ncbi:hypothetical protein [Leptotrichia hongkongensis]|uniref:hypothetical protein n=1 Tax=Leptotrichia hongkongensis TaxID=554406 RepID=UPI0035A91D70
MKKLLFVLMLAVMGNVLAASKSQKTKSARTTATSRISESERNEIENAVQIGMQPFVDMVTSAMKAEMNKEASKFSTDSLFEKDYVLSNSLKKEIGKKFTDEMLKFVFSAVKPKVVVKKINYISPNQVEVDYDIKIKNIDKVWDMVDFDEKLEKEFLAKVGAKNMEETEKIMKSKGNEELKKKFYYTLLDEMITLLNKEIKETKEEESLLEDISVTLKKVNGRWQVEK